MKIVNMHIAIIIFIYIHHAHLFPPSLIAFGNNVGGGIYEKVTNLHSPNWTFLETLLLLLMSLKAMDDMDFCVRKRRRH